MLQFTHQRQGTLTVLGLAAHPDDLEIGCAGTLQHLLADSRSRGVACSFHSVVMTGTDERVHEARAAGDALLGASRAAELVPLGLADGYLPEHWAEAKRGLRETLAGVVPDLVLCPRLDDAHQDHRITAELAWQLFRGATIWEYEITKWEGDLAQPNLYVPLSAEMMAAKVELLHRHYVSQRDRGWFEDEVFRGLGRLRGVECGARYAEAFTARKTVVSWGQQAGSA